MMFNLRENKGVARPRRRISKVLLFDYWAILNQFRKANLKFFSYHGNGYGSFLSHFRRVNLKIFVDHGRLL